MNPNQFLDESNESLLNILTLILTGDVDLEVNQNENEPIIYMTFHEENTRKPDEIYTDEIIPSNYSIRKCPINIEEIPHSVVADTLYSQIHDLIINAYSYGNRTNKLSIDDIVTILCTRTHFIIPNM